MAALENLEVMFSPTDEFDIPRTVCDPTLRGGMKYLRDFIPMPATPLPEYGYRLTLRVVSQYPGYIAPTSAIVTTNVLVAQPMVPDANSQPVVSPVKFDDQVLGQAMTDWIDRPPPNGSAIGTWTFEQVPDRLFHHPDVTFTAEFKFEHDPRILTVTASRGADHGPKYDANLHKDTGIGVRSSTVSISDGDTSMSISATNGPTPGNYYPTTLAVDSHSFTTSDPTGAMIDLIINARYFDDNYDDNLFVVITPKDFGDPAVQVDQGFPDNPFGFGEGELNEVVVS